MNAFNLTPLEEGFTLKNKIDRHEEEINRLNQRVFGCDCIKIFDTIINWTLIIIVYLKAFGVI